MSRKLFAFLLSELKTLRIVCKKCGSVIEMNLETTDLKKGLNCPTCLHTELVSANDAANRSLITLSSLVDAINGLNKSSKSYEVEFVLPDDGDGAAKK